MRRTPLVSTTLLLSLLVAANPAASGSPRKVVWEGARLAVEVPEGWQVVRGKRTPCTNPVERLTIAGDGALLHLQESMPPLLSLGGFPDRPSAFSVHGDPSFLACCVPAKRKGWVLPFRDGRRAFYAYVFPSREGGTETALEALGSLVVRGRGRQRATRRRAPIAFRSAGRRKPSGTRTSG